MNILFLSGWFPYPANNGSKLRIYNLLRGLAKHHEVTLLSFNDDPSRIPNISALGEICKECLTIPWREFNPQSQRALMGFLNVKPRFILDTFSPEMDHEIRRLVSQNNYDLVIASQLTMASYSDAFGRIPAVFEEIELGGFYEQAHSLHRGFRRLRNWLTWFKFKTYMSNILKSFFVCTVVSEKEQAIFIDTFPKHKNKVVVIPNCIDVKDYQTINIERKLHHLVFSGSFRYTANYHAALWFLDKVYPLILEHVPDTELLITGDNAGLPLPMTKNVNCTGYVEDIKSLIASCQVSIVPIWSGGGTRLKILEAMAVGTPVVSTSKGAEGLLARNGEHILIEDQPERFAAQVTRILLDEKFGKQLASNAHRLIQEQYDWDQVMPRFFRALESISIRSS